MVTSRKLKVKAPQGVKLEMSFVPPERCPPLQLTEWRKLWDRLLRPVERQEEDR